VGLGHNDGKRDGQWFLWDIEESIMIEITYKNGVKGKQVL
jgi:antitoxin component YwqK of YwqJK toxin-antitoxin module